LILSEARVRSLISEFLRQPSIVKVSVDGDPYIFEIADNDDLRKKGLMNRDKIDEKSGMLFKFPRKEFHFFWMKNTHVPLLACYLDDSGIINDVVHLFPGDTNSKSGKVPSKYIIEIPDTDLNRNRFVKGLSISGLI
jgi:uncharacterized membrane protein (UPF0127 family)